ncbi:hypothetical protein DFH07DRAFT_779893 [Mycena maculata]|uniref:Uncharacterized protein n=1 Tax=Mycena maculata TaxID=230809 RepID=A0AAD7I735_9AGAR|nr:hypothetical protein DFH07DRAFT_779893 [Mycena maculata]
MPENRETRASGLVAENGFRTAQAANTYLSLEHLVQYLTHTSVQWYLRDRWDTGIMSVSKDVRKFHIGMALVFKEYVLAFVTIDLLFQPTWEDHVADFSIPPNIYTETSDFLLLVSHWIEKENFLAGRKHVLACDAIRSANKVWYGIGVYTVMELFLMAGLSPFLTTARFLAAFYTYIDHGESNLCSCTNHGAETPIHGLILFIQQFSQDVLGKFASDDTTTCRGDVDDLYDVFEPTLVEPALRAHPNFGSLIFGEPAWAVMGGATSMPDDPLTAFFRRNDLLESPTRLAPDFYNPLFLPSSELKRAHRPTFAYRGKKEMWSVIRNFPPSLHWSSISTFLAICKGDPQIPRFFEERVLRGLNRTSTKLKAPGKCKHSRSDKENSNLAKKLSTLDAGYLRVCGAKEDEDTAVFRETTSRLRLQG